MSRKNRQPEENICQDKIRELLQIANITSMYNIHLFKETIAKFIENYLEAEPDREHDYIKYN